MATLTITIPDAAVTRITTAVTGIMSYTPTDQQDANRFTRQWIYNQLRNATLRWEERQMQQQKQTDNTDPINNVVQ